MNTDSLNNLIQLTDFKKKLIKNKSVDLFIPINTVENRLEEKIRIIKLESNEKLLRKRSQEDFKSSKNSLAYKIGFVKIQNSLTSKYYASNDTPEFLNKMHPKIPRYYSRYHFITNS